MQYAWDNGYYEDAITFLRNFLSTALKTNPHLDFAVLTGVLRIAKESIFLLELLALLAPNYAIRSNWESG